MKHIRTGTGGKRATSGATLVEFVVAFPTLLMIFLSIAQTALVYHAKSNLNYAAFEAARAGSVSHARVDDIQAAFRKAMIGYYGGGSNAGELAQTLATKVAPDLAPSANLPGGPLRVEIISPTPESFTDYTSPELATKLGVSSRVIPNVNVGAIACPRDRSGCNSNPASNASGQTLADANLLKLRITYGIPQAKQVPFVGRFYTWALSKMNIGDTDGFRRSLVEAGRIPVVTHALVRMQSEAFENSAMVSNPGHGNNGSPEDPGGPLQAEVPSCPVWDPTCMTCKDGVGRPPCQTAGGGSPVDPGGGGGGDGGTTCEGPDCPPCPADGSASAPAPSTPASG